MEIRDQLYRTCCTHTEKKTVAMKPMVYAPIDNGYIAMSFTRMNHFYHGVRQFLLTSTMHYNDCKNGFRGLPRQLAGLRWALNGQGQLRR